MKFLGIQIGKKNEWKLAIYIHQIVRLTLTMWSTEAKADGYLQGFFFNSSPEQDQRREKSESRIYPFWHRYLFEVKLEPILLLRRNFEKN